MFIFLADFVILDCDVNFEVPIILRRPFVSTGRALVDMEKRQMKFWLNNEEVTFNICRSMRQSGELQSVSAISYNMGETSETQIEERLGVEALAALDRGDVQFKPKKYKLDMKNRESPPGKPSIQEAPKLEQKALPPHLMYEFVGNGDTLPLFIASNLNEQKVERLV